MTVKQSGTVRVINVVRFGCVAARAATTRCACDRVQNVHAAMRGRECGTRVPFDSETSTSPACRRSDTKASVWSAEASDKLTSRLWLQPFGVKTLLLPAADAARTSSIWRVTATECRSMKSARTPHSAMWISGHRSRSAMMMAAMRSWSIFARAFLKPLPQASACSGTCLPSQFPSRTSRTYAMTCCLHV